ncbi:hypothetical protein BDV25DRAFT_136518 [Aspergillus avenaceus]|uniref:Uncharacterized protein n=1 Tax=Aspergillus avenaceus TaxID=36643 RepID=A0A5N6U597_ASPAV|nr:hypothetical protein BDV25DRAFT_136518 [Aspergillus avenaceus]
MTQGNKLTIGSKDIKKRIKEIEDEFQTLIPNVEAKAQLSISAQDLRKQEKRFRAWNGKKRFVLSRRESKDTSNGTYQLLDYLNELLKGLQLTLEALGPAGDPGDGFESGHTSFEEDAAEEDIIEEITDEEDTIGEDTAEKVALEGIRGAIGELLKEHLDVGI